MRQSNAPMSTGARGEDSLPQLQDAAGPNPPGAPEALMASATSFIAAGAAAAPSWEQELKETGKVVFQSHLQSLIVQVTSPPRRVDFATGHVMDDLALKAKFSNGRFETSDPVIIASLMKYRGYGVARTLWRAIEARSSAKAASLAAMVSILQSNPEFAGVLKQAIEGKEFALPPAPPVPVEKTA